MERTARQRPDVEVFAEIAAIDQLSTNRIERVLPHGLSSAGLAVLNYFVRSGRPENPARLACAFQVTKGAITNILQRLEAQGFVAVAPDPDDGRRKVVTLTTVGASAQRDALAAMRPQMAGLREAFEETDFQSALPFLRRLRCWLAEHR